MIAMTKFQEQSAGLSARDLEQWVLIIIVTTILIITNTLIIDTDDQVTCGQSPKNIVGVLALPTGKFLRVRKVFAHMIEIVIKKAQFAW